ncbi:MAG: type 11 methyltransferase [Parcubacteria group bacterium Gr01-1014_72]|nr:MAG: type 11 methyltransferase [Parcubacteria group bacterium Gr01-1014_72]
MNAKGVAYENVPVCDLCGSTSAKVSFADARDNALLIPGRFGIVRCGSCGLLRLSPRPARESLGMYYPENYVPYREDSFLLHAVKRFLSAGERRRIKNLTGGRGRVLDIGCARGDFLASLGTSYERFGLEMDAPSAAAARETGATVYAGDVETFTFQSGATFDCIVMRFVLEHLRSPMAVLKKLKTILSSGGSLVISIPNADSFERHIFGRYWHSFDVPRHFQIFSPATIRKYAEKAEFRVEKIYYSFVPNDWIGSISRFFNAHGWTRLARFFGITNLLLAALFFPLSFVGFLLHRSPRMTVILRAVERSRF